MTAPELNWAEADVERSGLVYVPFTATPDSGWVAAFKDVLQQWESETRGQTWRRMAPAADHGSLVIEGLDADGIPFLKQYLSEVFERATAEAARTADDFARFQAESAREAEQVAAAAADLQRRLRES